MNNKTTVENVFFRAAVGVIWGTPSCVCLCHVYLDEEND